MKGVLLLILVLFLGLTTPCNKDVCPAYKHLYESDGATAQKNQLKGAKKAAKKKSNTRSGLLPKK